MNKNSFEYLWIKVSLSLILLGIIIFISLITVDYSLILGWLMSSFVTLFNFLMSILLINKFFKKKKNKIKGFWMGILRFYSSILLQASFFIIVIIINKYSSGYSLTSGPFSTIYGPVNIFTYIAGISILVISVFITQVFYKKKGDDVKKN